MPPCHDAVTPEPPPATISAEEIALRKRMDRKLSQWRTKTAKARKVDRQVVMPGHCMKRLLGVVVAAQLQTLHVPFRQALAGIDGFGELRIARYGEALERLAGAAATNPASAIND